MGGDGKRSLVPASRFHPGAPQPGAARFAASKEAGRDQKHKASGHIRFAAGCSKGCGALRYREIPTLKGGGRTTSLRSPTTKKAALGSVKWSECDF
ncbi:hypothetical protein [Rhodomicrobium lacus]|uniref:hypothetical protein n=1 Tax=Rhodomicrobium lacus TaxID=2498452 RepID=UPI0013DF2881|nr:hypothetical protein [Rhodomicrobium lacus]